MEVEATEWVEIGLRVKGKFLKGYPMKGPSFASAGEPGEPDSMEDVEIVGLIAERRTHYGPKGEILDEPRVIKANLCRDVDLKNPEVQKLLGNIVAHFSESIDETLLGEVPE